jgi:transposase-like protein
MNDQESPQVHAAGATRCAETARSLIRKAKQAARRRFSSEDKIRIQMEGVRGEIAVAELCRREGIHPRRSPARSQQRRGAGAAAGE